MGRACCAGSVCLMLLAVAGCDDKEAGQEAAAQAREEAERQRREAAERLAAEEAQRRQAAEQAATQAQASRWAWTLLAAVVFAVLGVAIGSKARHDAATMSENGFAQTGGDGRDDDRS